MYLSGESLLIILLVGLIAGWLAGKIVSGGGFGFIGDIAIGIVGSLIGTWLLSRLGIHLGSDFLTKIVVASQVLASWPVQLQGDLQVFHRNPGTEFVLTIPLKLRS